MGAIDPRAALNPQRGGRDATPTGLRRAEARRNHHGPSVHGFVEGRQGSSGTSRALSAFGSSLDETGDVGQPASPFPSMRLDYLVLNVELRFA